MKSVWKDSIQLGGEKAFPRLMVLSSKVTMYLPRHPYPQTRSHVTQAGFKLPTLENDPEFLLFYVQLLSAGIKHSKLHQLSYEHPQSSGSFLIHPG